MALLANQHRKGANAEAFDPRIRTDPPTARGQVGGGIGENPPESTGVSIEKTTEQNLPTAASRRIIFTFDAASLQALGRLETILGVHSKAEVVRLALQLLDTITGQAQEGF